MTLYLHCLKTVSHLKNVHYKNLETENQLKTVHYLKTVHSL